MKIIDEKNKIELQTVLEKDLYPLWKIAYKDNQEWMKYDGPYFEDPIYEQQDFINNIGPKYYLNKPNQYVIIKERNIFIDSHFI